MNLIMTLLPTNVCFKNLSVVEVPTDEGTHTGYFAATSFSNRWYHTIQNGAGTWTDVDYDNTCGTDQAYMGLCDPPWTMGVLSWIIPKAWRPYWGNAQMARQFTTYTQNFSITSDGTVTVSKLGNSVSRTTNDVVTLNGVVIQ